MKTLRLIEKYYSLIEQDQKNLDPTTTTDPSKTDPDNDLPEVEPLTSIAEQSYISLAVRAFAYTPTSEQINVVNDALIKSGQTRPRVVRDIIANYLPGTTGTIDNLLSTTYAG